jgi:hypothetical protein
MCEKTADEMAHTCMGAKIFSETRAFLSRYDVVVASVKEIYGCDRRRRAIR